MKKKGIPVFIIILVLVLIGLVAAGAYVFLKTDIFKSAEELFSKNFLANKDIINFFENENLKIQENALKDNNYTSTGSLTVSSTDGDDTSVLNAITTIRRDKDNNRTYKDITLKKEGNDVINVSYINSDDIYALKCDDILPYYIGVRNSNLKDLITEYIGAEYADSFPDKIEFDDEETISKEEINTLINTYLGVISENIPKECYTKNGKVTIDFNGTDVNANEYELTLNMQQIKNVLLQCLQKAKSDTTIINIIKRLTNNSFTLDEYAGTLDEMIKTINESETEGTTTIKIKVYETKGNCIKTIIDINLENEYENNKITIEIENLSNTSKAITFKVLEIISDEERENTSFKVNIEKINNQGTITNRVIVYTNKDNVLNQVLRFEKNIGNINNNTITNMVTITMQSEFGNDVTETTYNKNIQIVDSVDEILELKNNNSIIINNYKKNQIQKLLENTVSKKMNVVSNKLKQAGYDNLDMASIYTSAICILSTKSNISDFLVPVSFVGASIGLSVYNQAMGTLNDTSMDKLAIKKFNAQFEPYLDVEMSSVQTKALIDTVNNTNSAYGDHTITLTGISSKSEIESDTQYIAEATYENEYISEINIKKYSQNDMTSSTDPTSEGGGYNAAVQQFNGQFTPYLGDNSSSVVAKALIDMVEYSNKSGNNTVLLTGLTTKSEVESGFYYKIKASYAENGYINKINISKIN